MLPLSILVLFLSISLSTQQGKILRSSNPRGKSTASILGRKALRDVTEQFPAMQSALHGYDIMRADPFAVDSVGGDPGFRGPIMEPVVQNGDTVSLHPSVSVRDALQCIGKLTAEQVTNLRQYKKGQLESVSSGFDLQLGQEVDIALTAAVPVPGAEIGGEISTTVPPFFTRGNSDSNSQSKFEEFFSVEKGSMVVTESVCSVYVLTVLPTVTSPKFATLFKDAVVGLWEAAKDATERNVAPEDDTASKRAFRDFIRRYGTHYSSETVMGSKMIYQLRVSATEREQINEFEASECAQVNGAEVLGIQVEEDSEKCKHKNILQSQLDSKTLTREEFASIGSKPAADLFEWLQQTFDQPSPLKMNLHPIFEILTVDNLKLIDRKIDGKVLFRWIKPLLENLCEIVYPGQCQEKGSDECGYSDGCTWDDVCENDECVPIVKPTQAPTKRVCGNDPPGRRPGHKGVFRELKNVKNQSACRDRCKADKRCDSFVFATRGTFKGTCRFRKGFGNFKPNKNDPLRTGTCRNVRA